MFRFGGGKNLQQFLQSIVPFRAFLSQQEPVDGAFETATAHALALVLLKGGALHGAAGPGSPASGERRLFMVLDKLC